MKRALLILSVAVAALFWFLAGEAGSQSRLKVDKTSPVRAVESAEALPQVAKAPELVHLAPPVREFREWFADFQANPAPNKLEPGKEYAKQHTREIARLIKADP